MGEILVVVVGGGEGGPGPLSSGVSPILLGAVAPVGDVTFHPRELGVRERVQTVPCNWRSWLLQQVGEVIPSILFLFFFQVVAIRAVDW